MSRAKPNSPTAIYGGDIAIVMPTFDRSLVGGSESYLRATIENLRRGGLWQSQRRTTFLIVEGSGSAEARMLVFSALGTLSAQYTGSATRLLPCENAGRALNLGALTCAPWVLYIEDDIDVCADFLDGVGAWLDDHADPAHRLYAFGAAYTPQIEEQIARGRNAWEYPVHAFYGTQAIALRAEDARSLGEYWQASPKVRGVVAPGQYDLMVQDWLRNRFTEAEGRILASCPSFVQHTGRQSSIRPTDPCPPVFDSWRGREWRYTSRRTQHFPHGQPPENGIFTP